RGPDDEGFYTNGSVGFGFRRLSIIDLSTGHQPLCNEDGTVWIVFNGEVYNFQENRDDLIKKGHVFQTKTDTETIVHLYEEYGEDCVKYLRGMFGFAIWDDNKKQLFCARDRFGIKPFFYYIDNEQFIFGSEMKSILANPKVSREMDLLGMDNYFTWGYTAETNTVYQTIKKLRPGHTMTLRPYDKNPEPVIKRYWSIDFQPEYDKTEEEWCELIVDKLSECVKMRLVSDVPLGAFLSGGVDSSSVVALMAQNSSRPVKTFSIGFKEKKYNELEYARDVAKMYGTEHHEQIVEPESISLLPELVRAYDEPFADSSAIPTYYVSKFAREYVTVCLSGDGGDELFLGYDKYPRMHDIYRYNKLPRPVGKAFWGGVNKMIPNKVKGKAMTYFLSQNPETVGVHWTLWQQPDRAGLYKADVWNALRSKPSEKYLEDQVNGYNQDDFLFRMQEMDMNNYMVDDILTKVDRVSMLNSLEARVPILDHEFAELSYRIPTEMKLKGKAKKHIFKKAMTPHLPESVVGHRKQGFDIPLALWFKDDLKEYVNDRLNTKNSVLHQYIRPEAIQKVIHEHNTGMRDFNRRIWSLLFFDAWLTQMEQVKAVHI
ncbi:MAG: asparagine synthase (glutamine-hydrolyzing), partial [Bacteroidota bacterium]